MNVPQQRWSLGVTDRLLASLLLAVLFSFPFTLRAQTQPLLLGDLDADGQPTVKDIQLLINHLIGTNSATPRPLPPALLPYADLNEDGRIDTNDLVFLQNAILGLSPLPNPYAQPVVNAPVTATNGSTLVITGVARPNRQILVTGGGLAVFGVSDSNGLFSVTVNLRPNQVNNLYVTASSSNFPAGTPQPLR